MMDQSSRMKSAYRAPVRLLALLATLLPATQLYGQQPNAAVDPVVIDSVDVEGNIRQADLTIIALVARWISKIV